MTDDLPSLELLDAIHTFPGQYTYKVIGLSDDHFVGRVLTAAKQRLRDDVEPQFSTRATSSGKHLSVTLILDVESAAHVLEIYFELRNVDGLVMLL